MRTISLTDVGAILAAGLPLPRRIESAIDAPQGMVGQSLGTAPAQTSPKPATPTAASASAQANPCC